MFFVSPSLKSLGSWFGVACFDDRDFKTGSPTNNSWCGCTSRLNLKATLSCHVRRSLVGKNRVVGRHVLRRDGVRIVPAAGFLARNQLWQIMDSFKSCHQIDMDRIDRALLLTLFDCDFQELSLLGVKTSVHLGGCHGIHGPMSLVPRVAPFIPLMAMVAACVVAYEQKPKPLDACSMCAFICASNPLKKSIGL